MAYLLRKIDFKTTWYSYKDKYQTFTWLVNSDDIPADPLKDLKTKKNKISMWVVEDDQSNLDRILAAIGATRHPFQHIDYVLVDEQLVSRRNLSVKQTPGETPDTHINNNWHRDIIELSGRRMVLLGKIILDHGIFDTRLKKRIEQLVIGNFRAGVFDDLAKMNQELRKEVEVKAKAA